MPKLTASQLRAHHEMRFPGSLFFSRNNMRFAGDTMANFAVSSEPVTFNRHGGESVTCWKLYRKKPVKHGLKDPFYFDCETFARIHKPL